MRQMPCASPSLKGWWYANARDRSSLLSSLSYHVIGRILASVEEKVKSLHYGATHYYEITPLPTGSFP